jgi:hypothetical protein
MAKNDFNPVKEEKDGVKAKRMIWSTHTLDLALKGIEQGRKLVANPFYEGNTKLLKGDLVFQRTDEEVQEWLRCKNDILYFSEKYCKLMTPEGIRNIELRDYQKKYLKHLEDNRLSIYLACRQCGKTTTSAIFMLHYILFNIDKNALVLGNKRKTAIEILDKAKKILIELPFFLRPGIYKWNEAEIVLDNGCRLMAEATTTNSGIGFTFHCVLADEFAHISPNIMEAFYNNLFPTITAARARFMLTSTQNGYNLFYRLYMSAVAGDNEYKPFKTDWDEVPEWNPDKRCWERRDEAWHKLQVANYGSEEAFNAQFGTSFDVSAKTLIGRKKLQQNKQDLVEFVEKDLFGIPNSNCYVWHPDYEPMEQLKKDYIVITVDLAEGGGGDYTVATIYRMVNMDADDLECIGYFRSNKVLREHFSYSLQTLICKYMNSDRALLSYEKNTYGELFYRDLMDNMEKDQFISNVFDPSVLVKYYNDTGSRFVYGIKLTSNNKTTHCLLFKESYERDKIVNNDTRFYNELLTFIDDGAGHYKASVGHDDLVMSTVQLEFVKSTLQYKLLRGEFSSGFEIAAPDENMYNPFETSPYQFNQTYMDMVMEESYSNASRLARF